MKMQMRTPVRYHCTPIRKVKIKNMENIEAFENVRQLECLDLAERSVKC